MAENSDTNSTTTTFTIREPRNVSRFGRKVAATFVKDATLTRILVLGSDASEAVLAQVKTNGRTKDILTMVAEDVTGAKVRGHVAGACKTKNVKTKNGLTIVSPDEDENVLGGVLVRTK